MTIREQIMTAVMEHFGTIDNPEGYPAPVRTRVSSPKPDQLPAITVYQNAEIVDPMHDEKPGRASRGAVVRRALDVKIEVLVKAVAGAATPADAEADPLLIWIAGAMASIGRVVTVAAPRGLCHNAPDELGTLFGYEQGEYEFVRASVTYRFTYQSKTSNVETLT